MALTPEEVSSLKTQIQNELEEEEVRRSERRRQQQSQRSVQPKAEEDPSKARDLEIKRLRVQVEERFYKKRGYKRYVDHRGGILWLTASEYESRLARRRRNELSSGGSIAVRRKIESILLYVAVAVLAIVVGYLLAR